MRIKQVVAPALLVVLAGALLIQLPLAIADRADQYNLFDPLVDIDYLITQRFVEETDAKERRDAMIRAMIETLEDPHTVYVPPTSERDFAKSLHGTYVGIGAEVNVTEDGYMEIISPMDGSPALEAGVLAGDIVLEIEGTSTLDLTLEECIDRLLGEPGTPVTIRVRHLDGTEEDLSIVRRRIVTVTVRGLRRVGEDWVYCVDDERDIAYVRVTQFNETTVAELRGVLERLLDDGLGGLLLDLRDNPGGELGAAVGMSDLFLDRGTIVSVRDRNGDGKFFEARSPGTMPPFPMIVLLNEASASASEIVAGSLQQNGRAKVLGTRSHGKGSVQEVHELPLNRGTLKITSAYYYLPDGDTIHRRPDSTDWGVDPDRGMLIPVNDEQYIEKLRARRDIEVIRDAEGDEQACYGGEWIRGTLADRQLARALELMQERTDDGRWPEAPDDTDRAAEVALELELQRAVAARNRQLSAVSRIESRISELRSQAQAEGHEPTVPDGVDLRAGTIELRDKNGEVVGTYRIEGGDIALALEAMQLRPVERSSGAGPDQVDGRP